MNEKPLPTTGSVGWKLPNQYAHIQVHTGAIFGNKSTTVRLHCRVSQLAQYRYVQCCHDFGSLIVGNFFYSFTKPMFNHTKESL